jgi:hypothetical protein
MACFAEIYSPTDGIAACIARERGRMKIKATDFRGLEDLPDDDI